MRIAVFTVTRDGGQLALRIRDTLPEADLYVMEKFYSPVDNTLPIKKPLKEIVAEEFTKRELLIFIMATGIAVRLIASLLQHKGRDPAVLVIDEGGANVISLLSGHIGGGNLWAQRLGEAIGGRPVITTASDVKGLLSIDMLALEYNCCLMDWEKAKRITSYIVDGGRVGIYSDDIELQGLPKEYLQENDLGGLKKYPFGVFISTKPISILGEDILQLFPRSLVVGIGCKLGTKKEAIINELKQAFKDVGESIHSISKLATIERKARELGIVEAAKELKVPLEIIPISEISKVQEAFIGSSFVENTVGVRAVSGPCCYLASNRGKILLDKWRNNGITISIAEICLEGEEA